MRSNYLFVAALAASLLPVTAFAHDPSLHEENKPKTLPKPTTCKELADTEHYSADLTDKDIKALKAKCDAEKKAAAEKKGS